MSLKSCENQKFMEFPPWPFFGEDDIKAVERVLRSGKVNQWTGNEIHNFEKECADYLGVNYAVALANGSVALDLALIILGIGEGDEVIVTPRTFIASASCIKLRGSKPVFADVDPDSQNITLESVSRAYTPKTKAVVAVHLAGWPCELDKLRRFCDEKGIYLIEDCAQAHGAKYRGKSVGAFGHVSTFSFCQDKIITTGGEGGLLITDDQYLWRNAWSYKDHGKDYDLLFNKPRPFGFNWVVNSFGTNYRMTEMQAGIGRVMLTKLDDWVAKRRKLANILSEGFKRMPALRVTIPSEHVYHSYYKYYVFVRPENLKPEWSRDLILKHLSDKGIPCGTGSCPEVYLEKTFNDRIYERLPMARLLGETSIMLLVHPTLNEENMFYVVEQMCNVLKTATK